MMTGADDFFGPTYFDSCYRSYDLQNPARKLDHYKHAVERHVPQHDRVQLLDVGCAFGRFLARLDPRWQMSGLDVSGYAIERARRAVPNARLAVVRDGRIPFAQRFNAVTAWDVLEHIPDLDTTAEDIQNHLVSAGVFLFVVPVYDGPLGLIARKLDRDPTHVHRVARRIWLDWTVRHFDLVEWWGIFRYLLPGGHYAHWPSRLLRGVAPAIAVVARHSPDARPVVETE